MDQRGWLYYVRTSYWQTGRLADPEANHQLLDDRLMDMDPQSHERSPELINLVSLDLSADLRQ